MKLSQRGYVLVHVLVTAVIVAVIAVSLARMLLMRYTLMSRNTEGAQGVLTAQGGFNRLMNFWNDNNMVCKDPSGFNLGFTCTLVSGAPLPSTMDAPGVCDCACTAGGATIYVADAGGGTTGGPPPCAILSQVPSP